jgi:guanylate kinase
LNPMAQKPHRGLLFVISAPSGVGKTTLIQRILSERPDLRFSVSCTTRPPRPGEVPGKDYHFLSDDEFDSGIESGRFLEWAGVHDRRYGTDGEQIENWLCGGTDVLLDIDVQGALQVRCSYPEAHTIFILPPSLVVLEQRLRKRETDSEEQITKRLLAAGREIQESPWYEFIIVNDELNEATTDLHAVLRACRCRMGSQASRLKPFLLSKTSI